jgi:hypothetical protein
MRPTYSEELSVAGTADPRIILGTNNYYEWSKRIKGQLLKEGVWEFVKRDARKLIEGDKTIQYHQKLKLLSMDDKARGILMESVGFHLLTEVTECRSARKVWKVLKKKAKLNQSELKGKCLKEIHTITYDFKTGMQTYLLEHDRLRKKLAASGIKIRKYLLNEALLNGIPDDDDRLLSLKERIRSKEKKPSYEYIRSTLLRNHEAFVKTRPIADDQVQVHPQNDPSLRESKAANSVIEALLTTVRNLKRSGSSRSSSSTCLHCRKQGHEAGACWTNPSSKEYKFCQQCQKAGHETSHCRKRKKPALADAVESFLTQLESNIKGNKPFSD